MKKYLLILLVSCFGVAQLFAQQNIGGKEPASDSTHIDSVKAALGKAIDSRKTGSSKDILTNFLNVGIDNLLGEDHVYKLDLSFFALHSIFTKNTRLGYERERVLKNNSLNLSLTGSEENKISKIAGGFTVTLLDKRDIKSERFGNGDFANLIKAEDMVLLIKRSLEIYYAKHHPEFYTRDGIKIRQKIDSTWNAADQKHNFSNIHPITKAALQSEEFATLLLSEANGTFKTADLNSIKDNILQGGDPLDQEYKKVAKLYAQKPLWTLVPTFAYDRENKQGEYMVSSNFTVGFSKTAQKPWELEVKSAFKIANDSTLNYSNYNDKPLSISVGVNKVLLQDQDNVSKMEFKFFTQYNRQFGTVASGQNADVFTLNATLRVNIFKSLWLPLTLKYDADKGNVFGLFTLTANIDK